MKRTLVGLVVFVVLAFAASLPVSAQSSATSAISGTVVDSGGGAIPGAAVIVKNNAGASFETTTNGDGLFTVPALPAGDYTVTVSLEGFKTAIVSNVRASLGSTTTVKAVLEVGQLSETITVRSSSELINTQTATVSSTLNSDQLNRMPTPTRNALNAVTFLPGVNTATTNRESRINGLPESFISITLDGVSNNDNFLRSSDSFFASVTPRQDAIEAVTVTTAVAGAQTGGSGVVTINFQTRSGTNRFSGSLYEYFRDPSMNTNYYFNKINKLSKNDVKLNQYGGRVGGPIVIPGLYDGRNKAFYFLHYERLSFPNSFTRTRDMLHPAATQGVFRYNAGGQVREVNVLDLAARNGQVSTIDPTIGAILAKINAATQTTGTVNATSDPLLNDYVWLSPGKLFEHQPTIKIDYNINDNHRLSGSSQVIWAERDPDYLNNADVRFPGAPNYRKFNSTRPLHTVALRSTLSSNIVNELRLGITALGGYSYFGADSSNGPATFADQQGFAVDFADDIGLTNWWTSNTPSWRTAPTYSIDNSVNWQRGSHSLSFGGSFLRATAFDNGQRMVPSIQLGFDTSNDPAAGIFTTANFPGASGGQLTDARALYALLTGRVEEIESQIALNPDTNKYVAFAPRQREGRIDMYSVFLQDSWRTTPTLTLTGGLRWDVQMPFTPANDIMSAVTMASMCGMSGLGGGGVYDRCNFFKPGAAANGVTPEYIQLTKGTLGYNTDWNNIGPTLGIAWRPNVQDGFLRTLLGDPEQATLRAGYSVGYERHGMSVFTGTFGANPGSTVDLTRSGRGTETNSLVRPGEPWPVLLRETDRLTLAPFSPDPSYPIGVQPQRASDLNGFAPEIKIASAQTWTASLQRSITRDMAVEVRYVGTYGRDQWSTLNYNSIRGENILHNGFLDEFRLGMANLQANNAAGGNRRGSFAYFGPGTGTNPLPTYLAYLNGRTDATNPSAYTGGSSTWTSSTLAGRFVQANPLPVSSATDLDNSSSRRANALKAGLPANFFVPNPAVDDVNVTDSGAFSDYHALQVEVRRRLSKGLSANVNYQYAIEGGSAFDGFSFGRTMIPTASVRHAIKTQWDWTLPVGRGERFGSDMHPVANAIFGGWSFMGVGRIQARMVDFGNVRLVGMTEKELQEMYKVDIRQNPDTGLTTVYMLPDDVILNTRRAWTISSTTPTGYSTSLGVPEGRYIAPANSADCIEIVNGDCAPRTVLIRAPWFTRFDVGVQKRFPIRGTMNFELRLDVLNVFDNINFNPFIPSGTTTSSAYYGAATFGRTTSAYTDPSNTYDPGGRLGQLMFRFNW